MEVRTKTLAEAKANRVKWITKRFERSASLSRDMPYTRTIEVHFNAIAVDEVGYPNNFVLREYRAVECVLQCNNFRRRTIDRC